MPVTKTLMLFHYLCPLSGVMLTRPLLLFAVCYIQLSQFRANPWGNLSFSFIRLATYIMCQSGVVAGCNRKAETANIDNLLWSAVWGARISIQHHTCWRRPCCNCTLGSLAFRFHPACWQWAIEMSEKETEYEGLKKHGQVAGNDYIQHWLFGLYANAINYMHGKKWQVLLCSEWNN